MGKIMNIEDDVKAAIEEFGERAHERFMIDAVDFVYLSSNDDLNYNVNFAIKSRPMTELFAHDVKVYGDNAYLMWYVLTPRIDINNDVIEDKESDLQSNKDFYRYINVFSFIRKKSAELPFDSIRVLNGDAVCAIGTEVNLLKNATKILGLSCNKEWLCWIEDDPRNPLSVLRENIRMKYPKKVQFGAWNAKT